MIQNQADLIKQSELKQKQVQQQQLDNKRIQQINKRNQQFQQKVMLSLRHKLLQKQQQESTINKLISEEKMKSALMPQIFISQTSYEQRIANTPMAKLHIELIDQNITNSKEIVLMHQMHELDLARIKENKIRMYKVRFDDQLRYKRELEERRKRDYEKIKELERKRLMHTEVRDRKRLIEEGIWIAQQRDLYTNPMRQAARCRRRATSK